MHSMLNIKRSGACLERGLYRGTRGCQGGTVYTPELLYVQEVLTQFIQCLPYKMGQYFLDARCMYCVQIIILLYHSAAPQYYGLFYPNTIKVKEGLARVRIQILVFSPFPDLIYLK